MSAIIAGLLKELPDYLGHHILLSVVALAVAVFISLPLAVAATRIRHLSGPLLAISSVVETIPGLALLA